MNSRWAARILGLIMILVFMLLLLNAERQLAQIAKQRGVQTTTTK
jgi:hypothetical protein